jgi:nucleoid-associated protein YgaU
MSSVDDVHRIAALADPVVRNLQITQTYHELSADLARYLPGGANWCTMATWASRQAGQSIRGEDLRRALERLIATSGEVAQAAIALETAATAINPDQTESLLGAAAALKGALSPAAAFDRVSAAVAEGNRKVFAEIGREFARFLSLFGEHEPPTGAAVTAFCGGLRPGDPPDGQRYLASAFRHIHEAMTAADGKARTELLLLANLEIGFHEQTRLQPQIRAALDAPIYDPADLRRHLLRELLPDPASRLRLAVLALSDRAAPLLDARDRLAAEAQRLGRLVVTEHLMTLELGRGRLVRLGQDLPGEMPGDLRAIVTPELAALLRRVDPTPDSLAGTGTTDWSDLGQRLHFIADLFRTAHADAALFDPPFSAEQTAAIRAGRRPVGV